MKKRLFLLAFCGLSLILLFNVGNANATAMSSSESIIDWTTLSITSDTGDSFTWSPYGNGSMAYVDYYIGDVFIEDDYDDHDVFNDEFWQNTSASASITNAQGQGWTSANQVGEDVSADATGYFSAWAEAEAYRLGIIYVELSNQITISANYSITQDLTTDLLGEYADAWAGAALSIWNDLDMDEDIAELFNAATDGDGLLDGISGTLIVQLDLNPGTYYFDGRVANEALAEGVATIPEPATMLLLGSGIFGLAGFRRKFKR